MTHRFDDDGGDEYDDWSGEWSPGSANNPSLLADSKTCYCCQGTGRWFRWIDSKKESILEKCDFCNGSGLSPAPKLLE
ncbi:hypothetical protein [Nostoc sp. PCC 9305]|uniref:hypothetical protein n=1 Tax=Nostoc sp. PCC 9305 TaxID=296636 RepID=UPI0039C70CB3